MNLNFIIIYLKILHNKVYTDDELQMMYDYILSLEKDVLISYFYKKSFYEYENDLCIYYNALHELMKIYEEIEEYEKCVELKKVDRIVKGIINKTKIKEV